MWSEMKYVRLLSTVIGHKCPDELHLGVPPHVPCLWVQESHLGSGWGLETMPEWLCHRCASFESCLLMDPGPVL